LSKLHNAIEKLHRIYTIIPSQKKERVFEIKKNLTILSSKNTKN